MHSKLYVILLNNGKMSCERRSFLKVQRIDLSDLIQLNAQIGVPVAFEREPVPSLKAFL